jgi:hypothetical protein
MTLLLLLLLFIEGSRRLLWYYVGAQGQTVSPGGAGMFTTAVDVCEAWQTHGLSKDSCDHNSYEVWPMRYGSRTAC